MSIIPYNPNDPTQQSFLSALRSGESGGYPNPYSVGYSGQSLSGYATDSYGFPIWGGQTVNGVTTHAAGAYQFQPGTWQGIAQQYGLNFQNSSDQDAGAWYLAQQQYGAATGNDLYTALQNGQYGGVSSALSGTWTSINLGELSQAFSGGAVQQVASTTTGSGNSLWNWYGGSEPDLSGPGTDLVAPNPLADQSKNGTPLQFGFASTAIQAINSWMGSALSGIEDWFLRGGLIVIGLVLAAIGLVYIAGGPGRVTEKLAPLME